jgi:hypothetical protein
MSENKPILYDNYTINQLAEDIHNGLKSLLCDYNINGTLEKPSKLSKEEQKIFDRVSLQSEILYKKLKKEQHNDKVLHI